MLFMQSREGRKFVGRLDPRDNLIPALKEICLDNHISSGEFRATGFLSDVVLEIFNHGERRYRPLVLGPTTYQLTSCTGNVSVLNRELAIHIHATLLPDLATGDNTLVGGRILEAKVLAVEFIIDTIDDFALVRRHDADTGLAQWVELDMNDKPAPHDSMATQSGLAGHPTGESPLARGAQSRLDSGDGDDQDDDEPVELAPGDILDHPRFRRCEVLSYDGERAMIKMESGRVAELHLSVFKLTEQQTTPDGRKHYKMAIHRRS